MLYLCTLCLCMVYLVSVWKLLEIDPWLLQWVLLSCGGASQCSTETKVIFDALDILHGVIAWEVAEYKTKVINNTLRGSLMSQQTVNKGMLRDIWWDLRIACDCTSSIRTKWSTQPVDKGEVGELHRCNWWLLLWGWSLWIPLWICAASHFTTLYTSDEFSSPHIWILYKSNLLILCRQWHWGRCAFSSLDSPQLSSGEYF